jgi:hypothetical protein
MVESCKQSLATYQVSIPEEHHYPSQLHVYHATTTTTTTTTPPPPPKAQRT